VETGPNGPFGQSRAVGLVGIGLGLDSTGIRTVPVSGAAPAKIRNWRRMGHVGPLGALRLSEPLVGFLQRKNQNTHLRVSLTAAV
jgi:hypothetical protein